MFACLITLQHRGVQLRMQCNDDDNDDEKFVLLCPWLLHPAVPWWLRI
jgi:hypothetical protein